MPKPTRIAIAVWALLISAAAIPATDFGLSIAASAHEDHRSFSAGQPGDPKKPARVIKVKMFEGDGKMGFEPAQIEVCAGERARVAPAYRFSELPSHLARLAAGPRHGSAGGEQARSRAGGNYDGLACAAAGPERTSHDEYAGNEALGTRNRLSERAIKRRHS